MKMASFNVTLLSDASMNYFPENTISHFRNKLVHRVDLDSNWKVALTSCSYTNTNVIVAKEETIAIAYIDIKNNRFNAPVSAIVTNISNLPVGINKRGKCFLSDRLEGDIVAPHNFTELETFLKHLSTIGPHSYYLNKDGFIEVKKYHNKLDVTYEIELAPRIVQMLGLHEGVEKVEQYVKEGVKNKQVIVRGADKVIRTPVLIPKDECAFTYFKKEEKKVMTEQSYIDLFAMLKLFPWIQDASLIKRDRIKYSISNPPDTEETISEVNVNTKLKKLIGINDTVTDKAEYIGNEVVGTKIYHLKDEKLIHTESVGIVLTDKDYEDLRELFNYAMKKIGEGIEWEIIDSYLYMSSNLGEFDINLYPLLNSYMGFSSFATISRNDYEKLFIVERAKHKPYTKFGKSLLFVYSDIVENQYVGDVFAPLLKSLPFVYNQSDVYEHEFSNPVYLAVKKTSFDDIYMFITNENGEYVSFETGTFKATLHFKQES